MPDGRFIDICYHAPVTMKFSTLATALLFAIVTSIGHKVTHNGMVETSIKVKGTGALSIAAA
jgi:hypothetical protein